MAETPLSTLELAHLRAVAETDRVGTTGEAVCHSVSH
jgi:hypothetical protein